MAYLVLMIGFSRLSDVFNNQASAWLVSVITIKGPVG